MTPKPPSSSDGSPIPPRHRPNLGNLAKDTTERDLWAFDDLEPLEDFSVEETTKSLDLSIPGPRKPEKPTADDDKTPVTEVAIPAAGGSESITVNISHKNKEVRSRESRKSSTTHSVPGRDFDELDSWEHEVAEVVRPNVFKQISPTGEAPPVVEPVVRETAPSRLPEPEDDREEFSPKPAKGVGQGPIRPHLHLTKIERIGLVCLLALLVIGGGVFYFNTINRLPTGSSRTTENDFPIQGSKVSVISAVTYWREPISTGENAETVRRDTLLIPVVALATSGGPAAIRIFFRDSDGNLVGDAVSRTVQGEQKFQVAATAGFDDLGSHAAYRTGQEKPWTIEVLEAPTENSPTGEFKRLFQMNISTDRR